MEQRQSIKTIIAKTLVVGGTLDPGTTSADHALIAVSIPGAQLVMLEAAHLLHIERQQEFTETLLQVLAALEGRKQKYPGGAPCPISLAETS